MKSFAEAGLAKSCNLIIGMSALVAVGAWSTTASAQVPTQSVPANCTGTASGISNAGILGGSAGAVSSTISGVIGSLNTAFLTQQGSAFVSAPANPAPDQPGGGGVWARALGGEVTTKSTTTNTGVGSGGAAGTAVNDSCSNSLHQSFAGAQVGADIARLNWNGWNVHLGTTAGFLGSSAQDDLNGIKKIDIEVPFFGAYVVATHGRFFADLMVRQEFYRISLDSPAINLNTQPVGAHGVSISTSAGYNFALANNWFIEPSAGFVWSSTKVDAFNSAVPDGIITNGNVDTIGGTTTTQNVTSEIGRLSVRVGTTIETPKVIYQPFFSASVFHEFAGDVVSNFAFCPTCAVVNTVPAGYAQQSLTSRVGTYGQYSIGLAAQIVNTGWLGFVRADYRAGPNIDGYTGNVGLRYQFSPDAFAAPALYTKAPVKARAPVFGTSNWSGLYVGAFAGGAYGRDDIGFANDPAGASTSPYTAGPLGGFEVGYNYQVNNWVFGAEADIGSARFRGARTCGSDDGSGNVNGFNPFYQNCTDRMDWMATAAAKVGYAYGRTLFYAKAGGAWTQDHVKIDCIDAYNANNHCTSPNGNIYPGTNANFTDTTSADYNRFGWLIGYGTEFDLGRNWSAKAEYDYIQFGRQTQLASDGDTLLSSHVSVNQVKIGLNYRLNGNDAAVGEAPVRMYTKAVKAPLVNSIYDWTGFYLGANVGGGLSTKDWEYFDPDGSFTMSGDPGFVGEGSHNATGPVAGGQGGYRWQTGRAVFGVEAQGNWANMTGQNESFLGFVGGGDVNNTKINSLGIFTGQVGYTAFDTLLYVKGGAVVVNERYFVTDKQTGILEASQNDTRWGAAVGAGLEYGFTANWTAGIDYIHGFMGTKTLGITDVTDGSVYETERIRQSLDLVTLRMNYKFAPGPVVAKY